LSLLLVAGAQDFGLDPHAFQRPIDYAVVVDVKDGALFSITYGMDKPTRICVGSYELSDADFLNPLEQRCFVPEQNTLMALYLWKGKMVKDLGSILVTIYHKSLPPTSMVLVYKES
jgi:hypothetical protein